MSEVESRPVELTSSEIATLWTNYQSDTLSYHAVQYILAHMEDPDIRSIYEDFSKTLEQNIQQLKVIFNKENDAIPQGLTEKDVNLNAPKLFSDKLCLDYLLNFSVMQLVTYSAALISAERDDVIAYFAENLKTTQDMHKEVKHLSKEKGLYIRSPKLPLPTQIDFVHQQSFLNGWMNRRPLLGVEITNLVVNAKRNAVGQSLITGFCQVAHSKEVRKYFERGREISKKHVEIFTGILRDEYLSEGAMVTTSDVTDSTEAPFSDKLMMMLVTTLIASSLGQYGASMAASPRHDLGVQYSRLMAELATFSNDGLKILIENGWMEQPPIAADREKLAE